MTREQIIVMVEQAAARYGLPPAILREQIRQESNFNPRAIGPMTRYGTAKGIGQFIDETWRQYGRAGSVFDPVAAADAAARYMRDLTMQFGGRIDLALAAYNSGPGNVRKYNGIPPFRETQNYVRSILERASVTPGASPSASPVGTPPAPGVEKIGRVALIAGALALLLLLR
jgi:soluble lytic murein transglycosylase-like protein